MPKISCLSLFVSIIIIISCTSIEKVAQQGDVQKSSFNEKIDFQEYKSVVIIPVEVNGETKNFLFDTGSNLSILHRDSLVGKSAKVTGASKKKTSVGNEVIDDLTISNIHFSNIHAWNTDMSGLSEKIHNFGGLIGQSIINKCNWLINYPEKTLTISNEDLKKENLHSLNISRKDGSPYVHLTIENQEYKAIIDLGSSTALKIPSDTDLADKLIKSYSFDEIDKAIFTIDGWKNVKQKIGKLPAVDINGMEFRNVEVKIMPTSKIRVGNALFKDHSLYIDNMRGEISVSQ